ncbi:hypothetical protein ACFLSX_02095 [Calditrichota bacterium]
MNIVLKLMAILFLVLIYSCTEKQSQKETTANNTQKPQMKFTLNNDQKWQMDAHTRNSLKNIDSILIAKDQLTSTEDYKTLGNEINNELLSLIQDCTMEGPAHDQLHVFLGYFYPLVQDLKNENSVELYNKTLIDIKNLLSEYHKYFD